jgi:Tfp pilus assembly protein PilV
MRHLRFSFTGQTGITLVEVLISLSIFSIGLLSLLHYSASSIKELSENNPRSMALDAATDSMVQTYIAANTNDLTAMATNIQTLISGSQIDTGPYNYTVTAKSLKNSNGDELVQADGTLRDTSTWVSPLSLGLSVQFVDRTDSAKNVTVNVPFTIVF